MCNDARYYKCNLHVNGEISNSRFDYIEMSKCCGAGAMDLANPLLACTRVGFWLPAQFSGNREIIHYSWTFDLKPSSSYRCYCCILWQYGFWSFQAGCTKLERFLPKNQHTQRKLLNFENWVNGEVSKSAKIWLSNSIFYVKNYPNFSQFFFHWRISI